jgi:hypothetical protein
LLVVAAFGLWRLQVYESHRSATRAVRRYVAQIGPPTHSLYDAWNTFKDSIGKPGGTNEGAVRTSYQSARQLQSRLQSLRPPPKATLFQQQLERIVANVLTVVENRLRVALSSVAGRTQADIARMQLEEGGAFYVVNQTFPLAMDALKSLESVAP